MLNSICEDLLNVTWEACSIDTYLPIGFEVDIKEYV